MKEEYFLNSLFDIQLLFDAQLFSFNTYTYKWWDHFWVLVACDQ
jgi:hypothetical protein